MQPACSHPAPANKKAPRRGLRSVRLTSSAGSCVKVRQQHLCCGHALAQRGTLMVHQRQQPLQRVGCFRQTMYQSGLVAAACGPSCPVPAASPCAFAYWAHLIDSFRGDIFCAWQAVGFLMACTPRLWSGPPPLWHQFIKPGLQPCNMRLQAINPGLH